MSAHGIELDSERDMLHPQTVTSKAEMLQQAGDGMDFQLIVLVGYSLSLNSAWALAGHVVAFCVNVTMV